MNYKPPIQTILGNVPSKSNCYKVGKRGNKCIMYKGKDLVVYEKSFILQCDLYRNKNIETDFVFEINVYYPSRRSDLDNSLKIVLDCLQKCNAIKNDNRCVKIVAFKFIDKKKPRIEFRITPVNDEPIKITWIN